MRNKYASIRVQEYDCTHEGMSLIDNRVEEQVKQIIDAAKAGGDADAARNIEDQLTPILNNKGRCVECGRAGDLPCFGMDFDGCDTHGGFMLDQDIVRCCSALCCPVSYRQGACLCE